MRLLFAIILSSVLFSSLACDSGPTRQRWNPSYSSYSDASTATTADANTSSSTQTDAGLSMGTDASLMLDASNMMLDASLTPDAGVCNPPLIRCGSDCVDPNTNAMHCGGCGQACDLSQGEVCNMAMCVNAVDCRIFGCMGFNYCDPTTNRCTPGCERNDQCSTNEVCNIQTHDCECEGGYHDCNSMCVSDSDPATCGTSCTPCPSDPNGTTACDGVNCSLMCNLGYLECQGACAECPTGTNINAVGCNGTVCVATLCGSNFIPCVSGCCDFRSVTILNGPSGSTARESDIKMDGTKMYVSFGHNNPSTDSLRWSSRDLANSSGWTQNYVGFGGVDSKIDIIPGASTPRIAHYNHEMDWVSVWIGSSECIVEERGEDPSGPIAFAVDGIGRNHVIYRIGTTFRRMRYAFGTGCSVNAWTKAAIGGFNTANRIDLVTGNDNQARTALAGEFLTRTSSGTWIRETIDPNVIAYNIAIVLDSFDNPHVSYYDTVNDDLWYGFRSGSTWTNILVADTGDVGEFNDIAIDSLGRVHIVYRDETPGAQKLMYAYYDLTQWHYSEVVNGFTAGLNPSIAVDYRGAPHIVYSDGRAVKHSFLQ